MPDLTPDMHAAMGAAPDGGFVTLLRPRPALGVLCRAAEGLCREDQDQLGRPIGRGSSGRPTAGCEPMGLPLQRGAAISRSGTVTPAGSERIR